MFTADLHIHSRYSYATSAECTPEGLSYWAARKGLDLIGTGDFTHPVWRRELVDKLEPDGFGLLRFKGNDAPASSTDNPARTIRFMVTGEISTIYRREGRVRKLHNLICLPDLDTAEALSRRLESMGFNIRSDGRPTLGMDSRDLLELTLDTCPDALFIPAHIWTPHFSLFGAYSGFDTIEECYGDMTRHIHALETGLSADPSMIRRLSALDRFTLISNSDAHSPSKLAREATVFNTSMNYVSIVNALKGDGGVCGTIELFSQEGKYHYDGHRRCGVCQHPSQTAATGGTCPVCGGKITVGVLSRVEALADRASDYIHSPQPRFESLIPLPEILAAATGASAVSKKSKVLYERILASLGSELFILRLAPLRDIEAVAGDRVAEGIQKLRSGEVMFTPGYDGVYGKVRILDADETRHN